MINLYLNAYVSAVITFKFSEGAYSVSESDGSIAVVLNIEGQSSFAITYSIFTVNSGDAYTAEGIYLAKRIDRHTLHSIDLLSASL